MKQENKGSFFAGIGNIFARLGLCGAKVAAACAYGIIKGARIILLEIIAIIMFILRGIRWMFVSMTESLRLRAKLNRQLLNEIKRKKETGGKEYAGSIFHFIGSFLFGEDGICYTAFNYIMPIVSVAFLIGMIRCGSGLEYGIAIDFNGREIGVISAESDFDKAEREVQQRISYEGSNTRIQPNASFTLKIISDEDRILTSDQLANEMLESFDEELTEAYGIYIDDKFIGAVYEKDNIEDALNDRLLNYEVAGDVRDVSYKNKIEYSKGIYLSDSIMDEQETIDKFTSYKTESSVYIAQSNDSISSVCQKYNMSLESFKALNSAVENDIYPGQILNVLEMKSYLPIQYVRSLETLSMLSYETVEIETSSLNVGTRAVLTKGQLGERLNNIEITYVDGIESSRRTLSSSVTKEPVVEIIGIGTYTARPDSSSVQLHGSGDIGWPVNGGYVSDTFISDRNHKGFDIAAPEGTDIYAGADGVVVSAGWNSGGYGYMVQIDHLNGYQTVYAHMSSVLVSKDQTVKRGQLIGAVGNTGDSYGAHCHLEVRYMGICCDPALFMNTVEAPKKKEDE